MISLNNITKTFGQTKAVDKISLNIEKGDIYGLLGPNGAGKTTTIRMLMGIIEQDEGEITWDSHPINREDRMKFGYLPEERGLYQKQKLKETLMYFGRLRGMDENILSMEVNRWLERFELLDEAERKIQELSKGNQQKLQFILALLHQPKFVILDEPFSGLDPINQLLLKDIIQERREENVTFIFSTHQMEQVERLCTNICLINKGKILLDGSLKSVKGRHGKSAVLVKYDGELPRKELIKYIPDPKWEEGELSGVLITKPNIFIEWLNKKVSILLYEQSMPTLEQIFIEEVNAVS